jgi:hypothetical protein
VLQSQAGKNDDIPVSNQAIYRRLLVIGQQFIGFPSDSSLYGLVGLLGVASAILAVESKNARNMPPSPRNRYVLPRRSAQNGQNIPPETGRITTIQPHCSRTPV